MSRQWRGLPAEGASAAALAAAFPALRGALGRPADRREVLRLMAASAALAGLGGCDPGSGDGRLVPAVDPAPGIVAGAPNRYATAFVDAGAATGLVVTQEMGRPIKVEGNPHHPGSLGATSPFGQALLLDFYDPDRSAGVLREGQVASDQALRTACLAEAAALGAGQGLRLLTGRVVSPSTGAAITAFLDHFPAARWHQWEPVSRDAVWQGAVSAYGQALEVAPHLDQAAVLLALESDLLDTAPGHLAAARAFAARRNPVRGPMSRVYAAEAVPSGLGVQADHRIVAGPAEMAALLRGLAAGVLGGAAPEGPPWLLAAIADLRAAGRRALVHGGPGLPPEALALIHHVNEALGGRGLTYDLRPPPAIRPEPEAASLAALIEDMESGRVRALLMLDCNPVQDARGFREALPRVPFSLAAADRPHETARAATWHVPSAHVFESWSDAIAPDGTVSLIQPQAMPLHGGRSLPAILALLTGAGLAAPPAPPWAALRRHWARLDDEAWRAALATGIVAGTASPPVAAALRGAPPALSAPPPGLSLLIRPDPSLGDGRWANNPWLQELPRPLGQLTWDNPLLLAPATARGLGLANGDVARLAVGAAAIEAPVWIVPGLAPEVVVAWLGGGRRSAGAVGNGVGTDVTPLQGAAGPAVLRATGRRVAIASTAHHDPLDLPPDSLDPVVRHATLAAFTADPALFRAPAPPAIDEWTQREGVAWGMSIDLNACIGCNACVVACMAENNVPVVGREEVLRGREMHWLRIDRYHEGPAEAPETYPQPMLCMQCENAPCEPVCPVGASVHDSEGLNLQVYNRCVGTRFCSNNCPYKVRRFNFGAFAAEETRPPIARNPDVTVRSRGVMEKCTFCVQRIAEARLRADRDGAPEARIETACQQACPTRAFSFGDLHDPASDVAQRQGSPLAYALLAEQNTRPRLTFEARIRNPHPGLEA